MTTYIGIEQNTDSTYQQTVIRRFGARRAAAVKWMGTGNLGFAFPGAARADIPGPQQNWHHRLRFVYAMPAGYRLPQKEAERRWDAWRGSRYRGTVQDHLATLIARDAEESVAAEDVAS